LISRNFSCYLEKLLQSLAQQDVGNHWVLVNLSDGRGGYDELNFTINVKNTNDPPEESAIHLDSGSEDPSAGEPIQFEADEGLDPDETYGDVLTYEWDFGDGTTDTGFTVTHIYDQPGDYVVTLTVTDVNGNSTVSKLVVSITGEVMASESLELEDVTVDVNGAITGGGYFEMVGVTQTEMENITAGDIEETIGIYVDITVVGGDLVWVNITLTYGTLPEGVDETTLQLYYWDGARWIRAENTGVDPETNTVWANVTHLTIFAPKAEQSMDEGAVGFESFAVFDQIFLTPQDVWSVISRLCCFPIYSLKYLAVSTLLSWKTSIFPRAFMIFSLRFRE